jgi:tRNA pseudouridine55 synthase
MKKVLILNKKEGETPLECMERFRAKNKKYKDAKMTYAGRLDPMASGILIVLTGDEVHKKEKYLGLPKEYDFQILFGFDTDTYDILGKVKHSHILKNVGMLELEKKIKDNLKYFTGKFIQRYPVYSSRTVNGKPLFAYARRGIKLEVPEKEVHVKSLKLKKIKAISAGSLLKNIQKRIPRVQGDFRQKEILSAWQKNLLKNKNKFLVADFSIKCGSGTYVRGIAHDLGGKMGIPALAYSIKRTKIGKWG